MKRLIGGASLLTVLATAAALLLVVPAAAQDLRGTARTTVRYMDLRPITQDTVSLVRVTVRPDGALEFEGYPVFCIDQFCMYYRSLPVQHSVALTQDVGFTAWGFGMTGLSATVLLRGRAHLGGEFVYPLTEDPFDAVLAYAELDRADFRVRVGRQQVYSQLGASDFDGLEVLADPLPWLRVQAYGGRSLARGLSQPRSTALRGLDDARFLMDDNAFLFGTEVGLDPFAGTSVSLRYQREIFGDRSALLTERASLSARSTNLRPVILSAAADYDFAFGRIGKAQADARYPVPGRNLMLEVNARRYVPYFELWTIWGFFSPVAYNEGELRTTWTPSRRLAVWGSGGLRAYEETHAPHLFEPLKDSAWRVGMGGQWRLTDAMTLNGAYHTEGPVGGFISSGNMALSWRPNDRLGLSVHGLAVQQIEEFRVGEGFVVGGGTAVDVRLGGRAHLTSGLDMYRQTHERRPSRADWDQMRGYMMLRVDFGRDAGGGW